MSKPDISTVSFVKLLLEVCPELIPIYNEHIDDYEELLEHVFMADVTRFAEQLYIVDSNSDCLTRLLAFLDETFDYGNEIIKELISVSFLENLSREYMDFSSIRALLGSQLAEELLKYD